MFTYKKEKKAYLSSLIKQQVEASYWPGYVHAYPHKKAYRPLENFDMSKVWSTNLKELNLYLHIPFCKTICSFCNLFKMPVGKKEEQLLDSYVDAIIRQIDFYKEHIGNPNIKSLFYGGGTPNVLSIKQLKRIQDKLYETFTNWDSDVEECIECSPDLLEEAYIRGLKEIGFDRVSIGVQTFLQKESNLINRKYKNTKVYEVYNLLKEHNLNTNIDLIYGLPGQTDDTIQINLEEVVKLEPETITIYPLAIRKLTGMEKKEHELMSMKEKYEMYDSIREHFESHGYECQTIVRYVKNSISTYQQQRLEFQGVPTLGIGAGARSYAPSVHYCLPYKIRKQHVSGIINDYIEADFSQVRYDGYEFNLDEQKRKFLILTLLDPGLNIKQYEEKFGESVFDAFSDEIKALEENEMVGSSDGSFYTLTRKGRKYCDIAVHIFESDEVKKRYDTFVHQ